MKISIELTEEQVRHISKHLLANVAAHLDLTQDLQVEQVPEAPIAKGLKVRKRKNKVWVKPHTRVKGGKVQQVAGFYAPARKGKNKNGKSTSKWSVYLRQYPSNDTQLTGQKFISKLAVGQEFKYTELRNHLHSAHPMRSADAGASVTLGAEQKPPHNRIIKVAKGTYRRV